MFTIQSITGIFQEEAYASRFLIDYAAHPYNSISKNLVEEISAELLAEHRSTLSPQQ